MDCYVEVAKKAKHKAFMTFQANSLRVLIPANSFNIH